MSTATQLTQGTIHDLAPGRPAASSTAVVLTADPQHRRRVPASTRAEPGYGSAPCT